MSLEQTSSMLVIVEVISNSGITSSLCIELNEFIFLIYHYLEVQMETFQYFLLYCILGHCLFSVMSG